MDHADLWKWKERVCVRWTKAVPFYFAFFTANIFLSSYLLLNVLCPLLLKRMVK